MQHDLHLVVRLQSILNPGDAGLQQGGKLRSVPIIITAYAPFIPKKAGADLLLICTMWGKVPCAFSAVMRSRV